MLSDEGQLFFAAAAERRLIASLSVTPAQMPAVTALAEAVPRLPILCHHLAFLGARHGDNARVVRAVVDAARQPNIAIKISGFGNVCGPEHDYPYPGLMWIVRVLHACYGPWRLLWGSDYPVSRRYLTYRQSLDVLRRHSGLPEEDIEIMLGPALERLLADRAA